MDLLVGRGWVKDFQMSRPRHVGYRLLEGLYGRLFIGVTCLGTKIYYSRIESCVSSFLIICDLEPVNVMYNNPDESLPGRKNTPRPSDNPLGYNE